MKETREFTLERPARKSGGDRYTETLQGQALIGTLYVNQIASRPNQGQTPLQKIKITIET